MRAALALTLTLWALGHAQAKRRSVEQDHALAYFQALIHDGHLPQAAIRRMLATHRQTGRLSTAVPSANGPAELTRKSTADALLATQDHERLARLLTEALDEHAERELFRLNVDPNRGPRVFERPDGLEEMSFVRLEPERTVQLWDPDRRVHVPFRLLRPLEVAQTLVTRGQWAARAAARSTAEATGPRFPAASLLEEPDDTYEPEHFAPIDAFLAKLNAENPRYRHRLPTPLEWMYFATDRGTDPGRLVSTAADDREELLRHAWLIDNAGLSNEVATRQPFPLADKPIYDLVGLLAELVRPNDQTFALGRWHHQPNVELKKGQHPLTQLATDRYSPTSVFGIRPVREEVR